MVDVHHRHCVAQMNPDWMTFLQESLMLQKVPALTALTPSEVETGANGEFKGTQQPIKMRQLPLLGTTSLLT